MTYAVTWQDPPPIPRGATGGGPAKYQELKEALITNAGKWALVNEYRTPGTAKVTVNSFRKTWGPDFEVTRRGKSVYARWAPK